jgi:uncharacterized membrane protein YhaH (DUF805 family)
MNFQQAVRTCLQKKYADFTGRAQRPEFWWYMLFYFLVQLVTGVIDVAIGVDIISTIAGLALLVPTLAVTARRLHDLGQTGWLQVVPGIISLALVLVMIVMPFMATLLIVLMVAVFVAFLIYLAMPGQPGPNKYGS